MDVLLAYHVVILLSLVASFILARRSSWIRGVYEYIVQYIIVVMFMIVGIDALINLALNDNLSLTSFAGIQFKEFRGGGGAFSLINNYFGSLTSAPVALVGSLFAIFIAHKSYSLSEATKEITQTTKELEKTNLLLIQETQRIEKQQLTLNIFEYLDRTVAKDAKKLQELVDCMDDLYNFGQEFEIETYNLYIKVTRKEVGNYTNNYLNSVRGIVDTTIKIDRLILHIFNSKLLKSCFETKFDSELNNMNLNYNEQFRTFYIFKATIGSIINKIKTHDTYCPLYEETVRKFDKYPYEEYAECDISELSANGFKAAGFYLFFHKQVGGKYPFERECQGYNFGELFLNDLFYVMPNRCEFIKIVTDKVASSIACDDKEFIPKICRTYFDTKIEYEKIILIKKTGRKIYDEEFKKYPVIELVKAISRSFDLS